MSGDSVTVEAIYEDGVFRPLQPVSLGPHQRVVLTIQCQQPGGDWPEDVAAIYLEIAEEDRRLAEAMFQTVKETWPASEGET